MNQGRTAGTTRKVGRQKALGRSTQAGIAHERSGLARYTPARATVPWGREPTQREIREIRERAYFLYLARGGVNGDPRADWLQAERELREELGSATSGAGRRF